MSPLDREGRAAALSDERVMIATKSERRTLHHVIGRSFAGTKQTTPEQAVNWLLGPHLSTPEDPERIAMSTFFMSFAVALMAPRGTTLCTHSATGDVSASLIVMKCKRAPPEFMLMDLFRLGASIVSAYRRKEIPDSFAKSDAENKARKKLVGKGINVRQNIFSKKLHQMHVENANSPHVYVAILATDPPHQRNGYGGHLMRAACRIADNAGLPAYLETGDPNRAFYESFGFEVRKTYSFTDPKGTDDGWPPVDKYHAMVRRVQLVHATQMSG